MVQHQIAGARGRVDDLSALLIHVAGLPGEVLVLRASRIMGIEHAESAIMHARRAFSLGHNSARTLGMETILYLAGERQISRALQEFGVSKGEQEFAILAFDYDTDLAIKSLGWARDDTVLVLNDLKVKHMLDGELLDRLSPLDLALEKVAMLDINR